MRKIDKKEEMMEGGKVGLIWWGGRKEGQGTKVRNPGIDQVGPKLRTKYGLGIIGI